MKCKCAKCYKELEEKDQVKSNHSIYCQPCHYKGRVIWWVLIGIIITCVLLLWLKEYWKNNQE